MNERMEIRLAALTAAVEFTMREYGAFRTIRPEVIVNSDYGRYEAEELAKEIGSIGIRMKIPVRELLKRRWPKDWWQAVRERFAPKWWLKRHPVLYDHVTLDQALDVVVPTGDSIFIVHGTGRKYPIDDNVDDFDLRIE